MSNSVTLSIVTNTAIAASKGFAWLVTGSPTLFAEMVHSIADVGNQVLLKIGEVRSDAPADDRHPFGTAQEKFFWALVSAVSIFFVGCGINVYHGVRSLLDAHPAQPFSGLVIAILFFALALESWTFTVALREIGGIRKVRENRHNTTVLAVLLEDAVALLGIVLTLMVAASSRLLGANPQFDAWVAIAVGALLGVMAIFLAGVNRRLLIDTSNPKVDRWAQQWLARQQAQVRVRSIVLDNDRVTLFVRAEEELPGSHALGERLKTALHESQGVVVDSVYWKFVTGTRAPVTPQMAAPRG
ncbi:MAG: cation transporter [Pseudomonadota bacterium]|nr:cation transporter [Pseudomonadota bacterium]